MSKQGLRLVYIISNINKSLAFEWVAKRLKKDFELHFVLIGPSKGFLYDFLREKEISCEFIEYKGKMSFLKVLYSVWRILKKIKPDVVHTHLFEANLIGLTASWLLGIKRRIYTRHHATIHHDYFPRAVYYDRFVNYVATDIIALSNNLKTVLTEMESVPEKKINLIPHGFDLHSFQNVEQKNLDLLKEKYYLDNKRKPVIGVISRYTHWKGVQYIIPAFEKLLIRYPDALLILANAQGDYEKKIKQLLSKIPAENYIEIEFENDVSALYKLFDVFVHTPVDPFCEAFGQTYVEALASGVPSIFTLSGIASDFINDNENALVVDYKNAEEIHTKLIELIENEDLRLRITSTGIDSIQKFSLDNMVNELKRVYRFK